MASYIAFKITIGFSSFYNYPWGNYAEHVTLISIVCSACCCGYLAQCGSHLKDCLSVCSRLKSFSLIFSCTRFALLGLALKKHITFCNCLVASENYPVNLTSYALPEFQYPEISISYVKKNSSNGYGWKTFPSLFTMPAAACTWTLNTRDACLSAGKTSPACMAWH